VAAARLVTDVSQTKLLFALNPGEIVPEYRAKSSRNRERDQIGMLGDIIADSRATSQKTQRRRETDSNHRSLVQETGRFGGNAKTFEGPDDRDRLR
jgi:hypothetical protein